MITLAIETSCKCGGIALLKDKKVVKEVLFEEGMVHGRLLLPCLENALNELGWQIESLDVVCVDEGPGSFTGLRIGAMMAKTLSWLMGTHLVSVASTDVLYHAAYEMGVPEPLAVVIDAYRGSVYAALYNKGKRLFLNLMRPEEAVSRLPSGTHLVGDGARRWWKSFERKGVLVESPLYPPPRWVGLLGVEVFKKGERKEPFSFVPRYLRPSEAEERRRINASADRLKPKL